MEHPQRLNGAFVNDLHVFINDETAKVSRRLPLSLEHHQHLYKFAGAMTGSS